MTKRLFAIFVSLLLFHSLSWGTGQEGDVLILDGEEWEMLCAPLEHLDFLTYESLEKACDWEMLSTANYRGHVAYWYVSDGKLYLEKVVTYDNGPKECDYNVILKILDRYNDNGKICAQWMTRDIIVGRGKTVRYDHAGFNRDYEEEIVVSVTNGQAFLSQVYHNHSIHSSLEERMKLEQYLKAFPSDSYGQEKGPVMAIYDDASGKWTVKLLKPASSVAKDELEKDLAKYLNDYPEEIGCFIRGEWSHSNFVFSLSEGFL